MFPVCLLRSVKVYFLMSVEQKLLFYRFSLSPTPCVIIMLLFSIADFGLARKFYDPSKPMTPKVVTLW